MPPRSAKPHPLAATFEPVRKPALGLLEAEESTSCVAQKAMMAQLESGAPNARAKTRTPAATSRKKSR